jgi:endonuclease III-like uncharacterized protein
MAQPLWRQQAPIHQPTIVARPLAATCTIAPTAPLRSVSRGGAIRTGTPIAAVAVDVDGDGRTDFVYVGADRDGDGIPDALESPRHTAVLSLDTVTLDLQADAANDSTKTVAAFTKSVAAMLEKLSSHVTEIAFSRSRADVALKTQMEGMRRDIIDCQIGTKQSEIIELVSAAMSKHGSTHDSLARLIASHQDSSVKAIETLATQSDDLQGDISGLERRLQTVERNGQETITLLNRILQRFPNGMDVGAGQEDVKRWFDDHAKGLQKRLDDHTMSLHKKIDNHEVHVKSIIDGMPDHGSIMNGVHDLLARHLSDHSSKVMSSINKLPLPPDEKVLLQVIENSQNASLCQTLEAIERLRKQSDPLVIQRFLDEHSKALHKKMDSQGKSYDEAIEKLQRVKQPPVDLSLIQKWLGDHTKDLHKKLDSHSKNHDDLVKDVRDGMPNHDAIMKGVHTLLSQHIGDHNSKIMSSISKLPQPPDEKGLLQAIENMQDNVLGQTLTAIERLRKQHDPAIMQQWIDEHSKSLHKRFDIHARNHDDLAKTIMDGMPDHDTIMKGVHGLLSDHMGDHSDKMMSSISRLPLPPDEKILLQAIENMQEASLSQTLEAIGELKKQQKQNDPSVIQKWLDEHSKDIHKKLDGHRKNHDDLAKRMMDGMPDHDTIMKGVHGLLADHMGDHSDKMMSSINKLPLPPDEKILLQAIENMQEASLSQTLEAIE